MLSLQLDNTANSTWPLYIDGKEQLISVHGRFHSNHLSAIKQAALSDLGIAFLPQVLIYEEIQKNTLTQILQCFTSKKLGLYAVNPEGQTTGSKVKTARCTFTRLITSKTGLLLLSNKPVFDVYKKLIKRS